MENLTPTKDQVKLAHQKDLKDKRGSVLKRYLWLIVVAVVALGFVYTNTDNVRMDIQVYVKAQQLGNKTSADFLGEVYSKAIK